MVEKTQVSDFGFSASDLSTQKLHGPNMNGYMGTTSPAQGISHTTAGTYLDTYYIYSFDGKLLAEYDQNGNCVSDYIYAGNRLIAEYRPQTSKYYFYMNDQVNSTRVVTDEDGIEVYSAFYSPYGDIHESGTNAVDPKLKFSGKERESYAELDYFGARYYDHNRYRFLSVDPVINKEEALSNPQLWNLYAYCGNNPITYLDPDGRDVKDIRLLSSGPNMMSNKNSSELGFTPTLGGKINGGNFAHAVNIVVTFTGDDSPNNYDPVQTAYVISPKIVNPNPNRPGRSDSLMSDNPNKSNVERSQNQLLWFDNPGLETSGVTPAGVSATYLAFFTSTVKPKRGRGGTPTDKILYWAVKLQVNRGKIVQSIASPISQEFYKKQTGQ